MCDHIQPDLVSPCPFCRIIQDNNPEIILETNESAIAFKDSFPVSPGHTLIIPRRHFADFFEATEQEMAAIFRLMKLCKQSLTTEYSPDGYNVGINIGRVAGQSVFHLHVHLIPRYIGDVTIPHGGVRHVIPNKGFY